MKSSIMGFMASKILLPVVLFLILGLVSSDNLSDDNEAVVETVGLDLAEPEGLDVADDGVEKPETLRREKRGVKYDAATGSYLTTSDPVESSSFKRSSSSSFPTSRSPSGAPSNSYHQ